MTDNMPKREMLPCPFCGGWAVQVYHPTRPVTGHYAKCDECGCATKLFASNELAIAAWNRRPPATGRGDVIEECAMVAERVHAQLEETARAYRDGGDESRASVIDSRALTALGVSGSIRALKTAQPASPSAWLPISSAPKDGTRVLCWDGKRVEIADWLDGEGWYSFMQGDEVSPPVFPTHWQPLPSPPGEVEQEQATRPDDGPTAPTDRL